MINEDHFDGDDDLESDSYTLSESSDSFFSDENVKNAIVEFRKLTPLTKIQVMQIRRYLTSRNLLGVIIFLRMELQLSNEVLNALLVYFGKSMSDYETTLSEEVRIDVMVEYLIKELAASEYDAQLIKALWLTDSDRLDELSIDIQREYVRVFNELGSRISFPAILFRELMDKVFYIQDSLKSGKAPIKIPKNGFAQQDVYPTPAVASINLGFDAPDEKIQEGRPYVLSEGRIIYIDEEDWEG